MKIYIRLLRHSVLYLYVQSIYSLVIEKKHIDVQAAEKWSTQFLFRSLKIEQLFTVFNRYEGPIEPARQIVFNRDHGLTKQARQIIFNRDHGLTEQARQIIFNRDHGLIEQARQIIFNRYESLTEQARQIIFNRDHGLTRQSKSSSTEIMV